MMRQATIEVRAVATTNFLLISSMHCIYSSQLGFSTPLPSSHHSHGPPESDKILGLTVRMYAIVRKVAQAPLNSVVMLVPRARIRQHEQIRVNRYLDAEVEVVNANTKETLYWSKHDLNNSQRTGELKVVINLLHYHCNYQLIKNYSFSSK